METQELCKNIEGDPATPGLAATTCWRHETGGRIWVFESPGTTGAHDVYGAVDGTCPLIL
jgi:hypothetical protein